MHVWLVPLLYLCAQPLDERDEFPGQWTQWRGPTRSGHLVGDASWPDRLQPANLERMWTVKDLGPSYSGPVVSQDRVFTTETRDEREEWVRAYDRRTGELLWETNWEGSLQVPFFAARNGSWIRSTPAFDGESLFVAGMRDVLVCLDAKTGEQRWRTDLMAHYGATLPAFGFVCSPLLHGERVIVQAAEGLVSVDRKTGAPQWRALVDGGGMNGSAFSSPIVATLHGIEQILVQTRTDLCGVTLDGRELWKTPVRSFRGMNILTPITYGDGVFMSSYGGRSQFFSLHPDETKTTFTAESLWDTRAQGYMTSPVLFGQHAFLYLRSKRFACVDLEAGKETFISEPCGDEYWSLVGHGDRMLALTNAGELLYLRANPEKLDVIDRMQLTDQETWAHLCVDGSQLVVREQNALTAYRWSNERTD